MPGDYESCMEAVNAQALAYAEQQAAIMSGDCPTTTCGITPSATALTAGIVGSAYSQQITGVGIPLPNVLSVSAGTLPPGLTLTAAGLISGTPTTAGTYNFTLQLTCG